MKYIFLLSFILNINLTFANNSVSCDFEELKPKNPQEENKITKL